jgi:hypothetical protein
MKYEELQLVIDVPRSRRIKYAHATSRCTARRRQLSSSYVAQSRVRAYGRRTGRSTTAIDDWRRLAVSPP